MAVLLYQIGIFAAIQIASQFGKSSRNTAIILITIFTLLQVFMSWLLLLQLITIFISYNFSKRWFFNESVKQTQEKSNNGISEYRKNDEYSESKYKTIIDTLETNKLTNKSNADVKGEAQRQEEAIRLGSENLKKNMAKLIAKSVKKESFLSTDVSNI